MSPFILFCRNSRLCRVLSVSVTWCFLASILFAYTYNKSTVGPLTVDLKDPQKMEKLDTPLELETLLRNSGDKPLELRLTYRSIETIEFVDAEPIQRDTLVREIEVPAKGEKVVAVKVVGTSGTLSTHYPVHLDVEWQDGETPMRASVVQPFESTIRPNPNWPTNDPKLGQVIENVEDMPLITVPEKGGLALTKVSAYRAFRTVDKENRDGKVVPHYLPLGWTGSDPETAASIHRQQMIRGGQSRESFSMHPSYRSGPGQVGVEYRLQLPKTKPIVFTSYAAMRDTAPPEPPSDGVTFQIAVVRKDESEVKLDEHVTSNTWQGITVQLDAFAGQEILLRLSSDPGPKRNTTCDGCYWGDPMLYAGDLPPFADREAVSKQQAALHEECVKAMKTGKAESPKTRVFALDEGLRAVVVLGDNGFVDGKVAVGTPEKHVVYDGIRVSVKNAPLAVWPTTLSAGPWISGTANTSDGPPKPTKRPAPTEKSKDAKTPEDAETWAQEIEIDGQKATMFYALRSNGPALQLSIDCSETTWISDIRLGPASEKATRVYYGHGYCVDKPDRFNISADGHRFSTSHVGMEYGALPVLMATTTPPTVFAVDSDNKVATLAVRPGTTLTLLPGKPEASASGKNVSGMFECTAKYRKINPMKPSAGVKTKAGRFCFDIWGGRYADHVDILEHAVRYGLSDALFISHNWQHYGYDNRLPDIWPPNSRYGTLDEMKQALELCDSEGILYGLHDNYIDFYPDADEYGFDYISFEADGQPRKAWINEGINARSYQFRPDTLAPFLERNLDMILSELPLSCYFVDVFSSMPPIDFHDREGNFHSRAETRDHWNQCFDTIRQRLTEARPGKIARQRERFYAPSISEAGHDALVGHLDGADCQFMLIDNKEGGHFRTVIPCEDFERVPWFDAVNHVNFSLHGVGYSNRYESGRGRLFHGIESDDYISAEILTGHALMVDYGSARRGAVRKYWLLQPTVRELADCEIDSLEYVGGDIHRQKILWKSPDGLRTTTVWVNRSKTDWKVDDEKVPAVLPAFGFYTVGPAGQAGIVRSETGNVVEFSTSKTNDKLYEGSTRHYVNGRQQTLGGLLPIAPQMKDGSFEYLGGNRFKCDILWNAKTPAPLDYAVFVHMVPVDHKHSNRQEGIAGNYGASKPKPVTEWEGEIVTPMHPAAVGDDVPAGQYRLLVGLFDAKGSGERAHLTGHDNDSRRYAIGLLDVVRDADGKVTEIRLGKEESPHDPDAFLRERLVPPKDAISFDIIEDDAVRIKTKGAFLVEFGHPLMPHITVTPLPGEHATEITLDLKHFDAKHKVYAFTDETLFNSREVPFVKDGNRITFTTDPGVFRYLIGPDLPKTGTF